MLQRSQGTALPAFNTQQLCKPIAILQQREREI